MKEYDFALTFRLKQSEVNPEIYVDSLCESGCDDALLGIGKLGYLSLDFLRESNSAFEAIASAINNVRTVLADAELVHVSPDLVGVKELADMFACSRQNIQKFVSKPTFPSPVYKGSQAIWHLVTVLNWFAANNYSIDREVLELSELTRSINFQINNQTSKPQVSNQAKSLILS